MAFTRTLGRSGISVSGLGMGCWAIGGPTMAPVDGGGRHFGWGEVDDAESTRALHAALDAGVTLFDTPDICGCGHSERILGEALAGRRHQVVVATKFGLVPDEYTRRMVGQEASAEYIVRALEGSLRRLCTDYIELVKAGKIRSYGWSTDDPVRAERFAAEGAHCTAVQVELNLLQPNDAMLTVCDQYDLAALNRGPLGMGLLTGKMEPSTTFDVTDVRRTLPGFRGAALEDRLPYGGAGGGERRGSSPRSAHSAADAGDRTVAQGIDRTPPAACRGSSTFPPTTPTARMTSGHHIPPAAPPSELPPAGPAWPA